MDELIIEDKKYVSSKRAAKLTGYAKDYVGQLCREGRVTARLVGRSWYVLESAIQDHRFGDEEKPAQVHSPVTPTPARVDEGRVVAKYEAVEEKPLPQVATTHHDAVTTLNESWKAWFDKVSESVRTEAPAQELSDPEEVAVEIEETLPVPEQPIEQTLVMEDEQIPIKTIYELPPNELLPTHKRQFDEVETEEVAEPVASSPRAPRIFIKSLQLAATCLALAVATLAIVNTGYLDRYIASVSQASIFSGISTYNK